MLIQDLEEDTVFSILKTGESVRVTLTISYLACLIVTTIDALFAAILYTIAMGGDFGRGHRRREEWPSGSRLCGNIYQG